MEYTNQTAVTFFILKGILDVPRMVTLTFVLVLLIYLISFVGNISIILLVFMDHRLQTPMYFFLCNLSFNDLCSTTVTLHNIFYDYVFEDKIISFLGCIIQMFIFVSLTCCELLILTAMSYDRYAAICHPLHYSLVMNWRICGILAVACWMISFMESIPHLFMIYSFSCYRSNQINHFFCDIVPLMKLTCSDTSTLELYMLIAAFFHIGLLPPLLTFISYVFIISTILKIRTKSGRSKAFYTCSSHLTVVILLYVTLFCQYLPVSLENSSSKKFLSLFNTAAVPLLNPLIYSLKNKDVKSSMRLQLNACKANLYFCH